ncbi:MAG: hypothetical protein ACR2PA_22770 [Hyphomicrobiaceae bacterium]
MLDLHIQIASAWGDAARLYADAFKAALDAHWSWAGVGDGTGPKSEQNSSASEQPGDAWRSVFDWPENQTSSRSWYRAPVENPFLAFWDEALRPWRTYTTAGWPMGLDSLNASMAQGAMMHNATDFWTQAFQAQASMLSSAFDPGRNGVHTSQPPRAHTPSPWPGFAVARISFPDDTEITITVPCPIPGLGALR